MKIWILLINLIFLFASCKKIDVPKDTPSCIKRMIKKEKSNENSCHDVVYKYDYKGESVYLFTDDGNCADALTMVYDEDCQVICTMGGLSGNGDNRCPDFYQMAENEVLIWSR